MRRRADAFSIVVRTRLDRSAQSNHCALYVRRSKGTDADRRRQGFPARQRALFVERHAHHRRGVFSHLSNQASDRAPQLGCRFATRSRHKFTFAVWTDEFHLSGATCAISAFVTANVCHSVRCKRGSAFFAFTFQLQPHLVLYSPGTSSIVQ